MVRQGSCASAITQVRMALCSAPSMLFADASTARSARPAALTAPARSTRLLLRDRRRFSWLVQLDYAASERTSVATEFLSDRLWPRLRRLARRNGRRAYVAVLFSSVRERPNGCH